MEEIKTETLEINSMYASGLILRIKYLKEELEKEYFKPGAIILSKYAYDQLCGYIRNMINHYPCYICPDTVFMNDFLDIPLFLDPSANKDLKVLADAISERTILMRYERLEK
jgi:hypothetical protein